jgi:hypothetical protein
VRIANLKDTKGGGFYTPEVKVMKIKIELREKPV